MDPFWTRCCGSNFISMGYIVAKSGSLAVPVARATIEGTIGGQLNVFITQITADSEGSDGT